MGVVSNMVSLQPQGVYSIFEARPAFPTGYRLGWGGGGGEGGSKLSSKYKLVLASCYSWLVS